MEMGNYMRILKKKCVYNAKKLQMDSLQTDYKYFTNGKSVCNTNKSQTEKFTNGL